MMVSEAQKLERYTMSVHGKLRKYQHQGEQNETWLHEFEAKLPLNGGLMVSMHEEYYYMGSNKIVTLMKECLYNAR